MLVQSELEADGQPTNLTLIRPPKPLNKPLVEATGRALDYLETHMPAWQPAPPVPPAPGGRPAGPPRINLLIDFPAPDAPVLPYAYTDENPVFATITDLLRQQNQPYVRQLLADPAQVERFQNTPEGFRQVMKMLVRFPPEALRAGEQGTVYAHVEIAGNGAIVRREILGSAGRALDAEVLQLLERLPNATAPARLHGQPVCLSYVLAIELVRI